ncbi:unnamed protein product [Cylindrotheca closterium]|uniref:Uncharacterized protein n=1 Tax=Cylindrotheca closterium TaxID=2856 RepID=A0AAD2CMF5_9STRA|nr:unnamed protein product [Cylindrotheca closterium]
MNPLVETLLLNNEAATLFHSNQCLSRAADAYQKSLCNVQSLLRGHHHTALMDPPLHSTLVSPERCSHYSFPNASSMTPSPARDNFYLFQRALYLNAPSAADVSSPSSPQAICQALPILGSVVLFNSAILYHKNAVLTGESFSLDKAQQLYKASLQFATSQGATNPTDWLITIAASNNLAQIAYEKGLIDEVNERLDDLSFLMSRGGSLERLQGIFTVAEIEGFLSNAAMTGGFKSSPAA